MWPRGFLAQATLLVCFVFVVKLPGKNSTCESPSNARMCVAIRSRNQRSCEITIAQPGEFQQRIFQRAQGFHVEVVGRFVEQQHVTAL